jgi:glucokinase
MTSAAFSIGLDLGGTNARAAAVDGLGRIVAVSKQKLADRSPDACAEALAACVREVVATLGRTLGEAGGIGLALAGQLDASTGRVIVAPNLGWRDLDFGAVLEARLGRKVAIGNDLAVAALGEARAGAARGMKDAILVFVGSGVGSGLILGGRLHHGFRGVSGEFGHIKVHPGGRLCGCGERGCLEAYAGGVNLGARAGELIRGGRASSLSLPDGLNPTMAMIERAAEEGDALCAELRDEAATLVGVATANLVTVLNPQVLVLGGGVLAGSPYMRRRVEALVRAHASRASLHGLFVVDPALGDDAGVIGSAFLAHG